MVQPNDERSDRGLALLAMAILLGLFLLAALRVAPLAYDAGRAAIELVERVEARQAEPGAR